MIFQRFPMRGALYISLINPKIEQKKQKKTRKLGLNLLYDCMRIKNWKNLLGVKHFQKIR